MGYQLAHRRGQAHRLMTHGKLSEQRKPPARRGRTSFVEGGRPHGFAALCRHDDSALERAHLQGRLWRLLAPSPAPEPFHPRNHGEGSDHLNSAVLLRLLCNEIRNLSRGSTFPTSPPSDGEGGNHDHESDVRRCHPDRVGAGCQPLCGRGLYRKKPARTGRLKGAIK